MKKQELKGEFPPGRTRHLATTALNHNHPHPAAPLHTPVINRLQLCAVTGAFRAYSICLLLTPLCPGNPGTIAFCH